VNGGAHQSPDVFGQPTRRKRSGYASGEAGAVRKLGPVSMPSDDVQTIAATGSGSRVWPSRRPDAGCFDQPLTATSRRGHQASRRGWRTRVCQKGFECQPDRPGTDDDAARPVFRALKFGTPAFRRRTVPEPYAYSGCQHARVDRRPVYASRSATHPVGRQGLGDLTGSSACRSGGRNRLEQTLPCLRDINRQVDFQERLSRNSHQRNSR
jgi:hypothetical protein